MLIDFDQIEEIAIPNLNQGEGTVSARMFLDGKNKIMISRLPKGASIGSHRHSNSSEINFVVSGEGKAMCDGKEESLLV